VVLNDRQPTLLVELLAFSKSKAAKSATKHTRSDEISFITSRLLKEHVVSLV
jgi:hypothetical protein